ncbi:isoamyl acetate-hydrolyzing esterase 1 homolog isoform X2 [Oratosquilla oratoria]|uniref:isoamyl acetate-hydrolyzing esterase 1 homolog isoform X2 n=1 Tax=Oratosquilla oratoria TaxID=337810 RepID=UPI003F7623A6
MYSFSSEGCWGTLLADTFQRRADVVNRGFSGYNTRMCRDMLPFIAPDLKDVVAATVLLGSNDASLEANTQQRVELEEYISNLKEIVKYFKDGGVKHVVLITPPMLDGKTWSSDCLVSKRIYTKNEELTKEYAQACSALAESSDLPCVDLYSAMSEMPDWKEHLCDGLHLSAKGSKLLAMLLIPLLEERLANECRFLLPYWNDVNCSNPKESFKKFCKDD